MKLTCIPYCMLLAFPWLEIYRFSELVILLIDCHFLTLGKTKLTLLVYFYCFGQATVILLSLGKTVGCRKQSKPSLSDKKLGSGTRYFQWFNQQESRTGWVPQLINRLQVFNLLFLSVTWFSDLCRKIKYATKSCT